MSERRGNRASASLPWPAQWQAHPDYDLLQQRCRDLREQIDALIARMAARRRQP